MTEYNKLMEEYLNYNPDKDYNGSKGIAIAEAVFQKCNYDLKKLKFEIALKKLEQKIKTS